VFVSSEESIATRKLKPLIESELSSLGLRLNEAHPDYVLGYFTETKNYTSSGVMPMPQTSTTQGNLGTPGAIGTIPYSQTTRSTAYIPYNKRYQLTKMWLKLHRKSDLRANNFMAIWEGYIGADKEDFDRYTASLIHEVLKHFGSDYAKHTTIDRTFTAPPAIADQVFQNSETSSQSVYDQLQNDITALYETRLSTGQTVDQMRDAADVILGQIQLERELQNLSEREALWLTSDILIIDGIDPLWRTQAWRDHVVAFLHNLDLGVKEGSVTGDEADFMKTKLDRLK